jgi:hypothetical protein
VEAEKGYSTDIRSKADWEDEVLGIAGGGKIERNRGKFCIFPPRNFFDNFFFGFLLTHINTRRSVHRSLLTKTMPSSES